MSPTKNKTNSFLPLQSFKSTVLWRVIIEQEFLVLGSACPWRPSCRFTSCPTQEGEHNWFIKHLSTLGLAKLPRDTGRIPGIVCILFLFHFVSRNIKEYNTKEFFFVAKDIFLSLTLDTPWIKNLDCPLFEIYYTNTIFMWSKSTVAVSHSLD